MELVTTRIPDPKFGGVTHVNMTDQHPEVVVAHQLDAVDDTGYMQWYSGITQIRVGKPQPLPEPQYSTRALFNNSQAFDLDVRGPAYMAPVFQHIYLSPEARKPKVGETRVAGVIDMTQPSQQVSQAPTQASVFAAGSSSRAEKMDIYLPVEEKWDINKRLKWERMDAIRRDWGWGGWPGSGPIKHDLKWTLDTSVMQSLEPKGWLDDRIIYAYMWLLRDREEDIAVAGVYPRMPSYYFMDPLFMELAKKVDYSRPYSPRTMHFFVNWASCGVGPPINQKWGMMVLDPMNYNAQYPEEEECVVGVVGGMLRYVGKNRNIPDEEPLVHVWDAMPKQDNYSDCGVYVCKYMDYTLQGYDLAKVCWDASDVEIFCYRIAKELQRGMSKPIPTHRMRQRMERVAGKSSS
ncbi:hypothetical protein AgCh_008293 [Apium graveolens]